MPDIGKIFSSGESILKQVYFDSHEPNVINLDILSDNTNLIFDSAISLLNIICE